MIKKLLVLLGFLLIAVGGAVIVIDANAPSRWRGIKSGIPFLDASKLADMEPGAVRVPTAVNSLAIEWRIKRKTGIWSLSITEDSQGKVNGVYERYDGDFLGFSRISGR
jgi:hypothetical protein